MKSNDYELLPTTSGRSVKLWTLGVPVEQAARDQLANQAQLPFIYRHVAMMPDVYLGKGSTIGSVIPTQGAVISTNHEAVSLGSVVCRTSCHVLLRW
jgi:tRNA-splicing ligase RtcB (3'-phosphate/5'-hydroxy nucleic acid ligase)